MAGRTVLLLLVALGIFHVLSVRLHRSAVDTALLATGDAALVERIADIRRALAAQPPERREAEAHALSGASLAVHWDTTTAVHSAPEAPPKEFEARLRRIMEGEGAPELHVVFEGAPSANGGEGGHLMLASVALPDGSWMTLRALRFPFAEGRDTGFWASLLVMTLGIVLVSVFVVHGLTAPLRSLAVAADAMDPNGAGTELAETGPDEVRLTAAAFNRMRNRIRLLFDEQRRSLAAMSHDLMSPIARLKYRLEALEDPVLQAQFARDLDEMETMARGVLDFLRGETEAEVPRRFDLAATLRTLCDELADRGATISYDGPEQLAMLGRHLALKRAFANLVENAVRHGGSRTGVALRRIETGDAVAVDVTDDGPGIPAAELPRVGEPFYRVDQARQRKTGGTGLGLTIAMAAVKRHGGSIELRNRSDGGLQVTVVLADLADDSTFSTHIRHGRRPLQ